MKANKHFFCADIKAFKTIKICRGFFLCAVIFLCISNAVAQKCPDPTTGFKKDYKRLQGWWVCKEDTLYKVNFKNGALFEFYGDSPLDTFSFIITHVSCDPRYMSASNVKFMQKKKNGNLYCYEINNLTNSLLVMNYLFHERTYNFRRIKG